MDGEEFPYPGILYGIQTGAFARMQRASSDSWRLSQEDAAIFTARANIRVHTQYAMDEYMDLLVMHARTSCPGVKPAMKNLAVFLKYS